MLRNVIGFDDAGKLQTTADINPRDLWLELLRFFRQVRPVKASARWETTYPETTNDDVRQLAAMWTTEHEQRFSGDPTEKERGAPWRKALVEIDAALVGADPKVAFRRNEEFWFEWSLRHAAQLSVMHGGTRAELMRAAIADHIQALPDRLTRGAKNIASALPKVAALPGNVIGSSVRGIFDGLFGGLGVPLLIGAAVVVGGVVIIPRLLAKRTPTAMALPEGKPVQP